MLLYKVYGIMSIYMHIRPVPRGGAGGACAPPFLAMQVGTCIKFINVTVVYCDVPVIRLLI